MTSVVAARPSEPWPARPADPLLGHGVASEEVADFGQRVRSLLRAEVLPLALQAEEARRFPTDVIRRLGRSGLIRERWSPLPNGDPGKAILISEELGHLGFAGVSIGVSLHMESVLSILTRYARTPLAHHYLEGALDGALIGCLAASEPGGGSDLLSVQTVLTPCADGWHLRGEKKFVSLSTVADFSLVLCRVDAGDQPAPGRARLALVIVPRQDMQIRRVLDKAGARSLETAWVSYDSMLPPDAVLGRIGTGLLLVTYGLTHERLAIAAQIVGVCELATGLATAHLKRRHQFGVALMDHQALRLRLADLVAKTSLLRMGVRAMGTDGRAFGADTARTIAGLKVTAARMGCDIVSECMHLFGGAGYLDDETPMSRLWRDVRLSRIGAGTDEMMWEMVAGGLVPDNGSYDEQVGITC